MRIFVGRRFVALYPMSALGAKPWHTRFSIRRSPLGGFDIYGYVWGRGVIGRAGTAFS